MGQGHAEGLHELVAFGRDRHATSREGLAQRRLDERKPVTGAFDGGQVKAVTFAINTNARQHALQCLNGSSVWYVLAFLDVSSPLFKMVEATANAPKKKSKGCSPSPSARTRPRSASP